MLDESFLFRHELTSNPQERYPCLLTQDFFFIIQAELVINYAESTETTKERKEKEWRCFRRNGYLLFYFGKSFLLIPISPLIFL